jgi:hypothetical protein
VAWRKATQRITDRLRVGVLGTGELHSTPDVLQKEIGSRYSGHFVIGLKRLLDFYFLFAFFNSAHLALVASPILFRASANIFRRFRRFLTGAASSTVVVVALIFSMTVS